MDKTTLQELEGITGAFKIATKLLVDGDRRFWIADDYESYVAGFRKSIPLPGDFWDQLLPIFSPYGGGMAFYCEECEAEVEFDKGEIAVVREITVRRPNKGLEMSWRFEK